MSSKSVLPERCAVVSSKGVLQECHLSVSSPGVPQVGLLDNVIHVLSLFLNIRVGVRVRGLHLFIFLGGKTPEVSGCFDQSLLFLMYSAG